MSKESDFSRRLVSLRIRNRLTQEQLSDTLMVSRTAISNYERGISRPDIFTIRVLAQIFGVTADYLLGMTNTVEFFNQRVRLSQSQIEQLKKEITWSFFSYFKDSYEFRAAKILDLTENQWINHKN